MLVVPSGTHIEILRAQEFRIREFRKRNVYQLIFLKQVPDFFPPRIVFSDITSRYPRQRTVIDLQFNAGIQEILPYRTVRHTDVVNDSQ